jgi:phosphatidylserine decarboxylase
MSYQLARGGVAHLAVGGIFLLPAVLCGVYGYGICSALFALIFVLYMAFMLYFFRDPDRDPPGDPLRVVAGADGWVRSVESIDSPKDFDRPSVRISTYLTPWDVHVNRAPIGGKVVKLGYTPGKHILTRNPASSEYNEHSTILIQGERIPCLVRQIVGPLVRRVIYWLDEGQALSHGDRIGMMKFGSRLDVYLPADQVMVTVKAGDRVFAGITEIARITDKAGHGA